MEDRGLGVGSSSMVELKTELYKKTEELKRAKALGSTIKPVKSSTKAKSVFSKRNAGVDKRAARDGENLSMEEEDALVKSKRALERKAALYDKLMSGKVPVPVDDDNNDKGFLVDFFQKSYEKRQQEGPVSSTKGDDDDENYCLGKPPPAETRDDEWVDFVDSLGRSRRCLRRDLPELQHLDRQLSGKPEAPPKAEKEVPTLLSEDMRNELRRQQWEEQERELAERNGPIHYEDIKFDEVRDMGVGYYQFSRDEQERQEQMAQLEQLRQQTIEQRNRRDQIKERRQAALEARLKKVRARRAKLQKGDGDGAAEEQEEEEEGEVREDLAAKDDKLDEERSEFPDVSIEVLRQKEAERRAAMSCEWDRGKGTKQADSLTVPDKPEREEEFAPPVVYSKKRSSSAAFENTVPDLSAKAKVPRSFSVLLQNAKETHEGRVQEAPGTTFDEQPKSEDVESAGATGKPNEYASLSTQSTQAGSFGGPQAATVGLQLHAHPPPPHVAHFPGNMSFPQSPHEFSSPVWPATCGGFSNMSGASMNWQTHCVGVPAHSATSVPTLYQPTSNFPMPLPTFPMTYPPHPGAALPPPPVPQVSSLLPPSSYPHQPSAVMGPFPQTSFPSMSQPGLPSVQPTQLPRPTSHKATAELSADQSSVNPGGEKLSSKACERSEENTVQSAIKQFLAECRAK